MPRPLALVLGLAIAAAALYSLASLRGGAPMDEIDERSRAHLERVLEQAEREAEGGP